VEHQLDMVLLDRDEGRWIAEIVDAGRTNRRRRGDLDREVSRWCEIDTGWL
jgi:hypothetical protein